MNKEQQVEEMARELCGKSKFINGEYVCGMLNFKCNCHCNYGSYAESSINAGYQKVGEDEMVVKAVEWDYLLGKKVLEHEERENAIRIKLSLPPDKVKMEAQKELLNLLLTDYEPYIDKEIVEEIAKKVGVEI